MGRKRAKASPIPDGMVVICAAVPDAISRALKVRQAIDNENRDRVVERALRVYLANELRTVGAKA